MCDIPTYYIEKRFKDLQARVAELEERVESHEPFPVGVEHPGPRLMLLLLTTWLPDKRGESDDVAWLSLLCGDFCDMDEEYVCAYLPRLQLVFAALPRYYWDIFKEEYQRAFKAPPPPLPGFPSQLPRPRWTPAERVPFAAAPAQLRAASREPDMLPGEDGSLLKEYEDWRNAQVIPHLPQLIRLHGALASEIIELENRSRNTRPSSRRRGLLARAAEKWARVLSIEPPILWDKPGAAAGNNE